MTNSMSTNTLSQLEVIIPRWVYRRVLAVAVHLDLDPALWAYDALAQAAGRSLHFAHQERLRQPIWKAGCISSETADATSASGGSENPPMQGGDAVQEITPTHPEILWIVRQGDPKRSNRLVLSPSQARLIRTAARACHMRAARFVVRVLRDAADAPCTPRML